MKTSNLIDLGNLVGSKKLVQFDVPTLLETGLVIQAQSGGGKSHAIRRILEKTHPLVQQVVLDLEGEFPTLRELFDYIIAGKGGDIGLTVGQKMPQLLATKLLELRASAIMDLYELKAHDRIRFVRLFLESVMDAPKSLYHSVLFVLDEAHHFSPQQGEAESFSAVIDLCARGRKRGFRPILATQRISKLHKDTCAELGNKMIGRTGLDIDQKRAADELDMGKSERLNLRNLKPGEFHVYGPALRIDGKAESGVVLCKVGPVKSRHPQAGMRQLEAPPEASSAVKKIVTSLANLPAEAEAKAKSEEDLRKEIATLRHKLTLSEKNLAVPAGVEERIAKLEHERQHWKQLSETAGNNRAHAVRRLESLTGSIVSKLQSILDACQKISGETIKENAEFEDLSKKKPTLAIDSITKTQINIDSTEIDEAKIRSFARAISNRSQRQPLTRSLPRPGKAERSDLSDPPEGPTASQKRILDALARFESLGLTSPKTQVVAAMSGYTHSGGAWNNNRSRLNVLGLVQISGGTMQLTEQGREMANFPDQPVTSVDLQQAWSNLFPAAVQKMFNVIINIHPQSISKEELAEATNYTVSGGAFNNNLSRLRSTGAVVNDGNGRVRASDLVFPEGLV